MKRTRVLSILELQLGRACQVGYDWLKTKCKEMVDEAMGKDGRTIKPSCRLSQILSCSVFSISSPLHEGAYSSSIFIRLTSFEGLLTPKSCSDHANEHLLLVLNAGGENSV